MLRGDDHGVFYAPLILLHATLLPREDQAIIHPPPGAPFDDLHVARSPCRVELEFFHPYIQAPLHRLPLSEEAEIGERGDRLVRPMPGDEFGKVSGHEFETTQIQSDQHVDLDRIFPKFAVSVGVHRIAIKEMAIDLLRAAAPELHLDFSVNLEQVVKRPEHLLALRGGKVVVVDLRVSQYFHELRRGELDDNTILLVRQDIDSAQHLTLLLVQPDPLPIPVPQVKRDGKNDILAVGIVNLLPIKMIS
jgi:hypothetical protein